jgi:hypothetical protein
MWAAIGVCQAYRDDQVFDNGPEIKCVEIDRKCDDVRSLKLKSKNRYVAQKVQLKIQPGQISGLAVTVDPGQGDHDVSLGW